VGIEPVDLGPEERVVEVHPGEIPEGVVLTHEMRALCGCRVLRPDEGRAMEGARKREHHRHPARATVRAGVRNVTSNHRSHPIGRVRNWEMYPNPDAEQATGVTLCRDRTPGWERETGLARIAY